MGQYYIAVILAEDGTYVRAWLSSYAFNNGSKLMEHSYLDNPFVTALENMIGPDGMFYKSRIVWAGDYADNEQGKNVNLHSMMIEDDNKQCIPKKRDESFRFIVNHTKKIYIDKSILVSDIHPLPLLTAEGNGRGGGDYNGEYKEDCGSWARDVISMEKDPPVDYIEITTHFA